MDEKRGLQILTEINLDDLVNAFGWQNHPFPAGILRRIFFGTARKFAQQMLNFDVAVEATGLAEAACRTERLFARDVQIYDAHLLPDGPFIALANHPGVTDTLALLSAVGRHGLKIIALDRPFLLSLPNLSQRLFYVTEDSRERVALVRRVSKHVRDGGSILTFPAGRNEPDPDVYPGAIESLADWTDSVGVFLRLAPGAAVLPICVRGVVWSKAARHPFPMLRRTRDDQLLLASALQLLASLIFRIRPVTVRVQVGHPITVRELGSSNAQVVHHAVLKEMRRLIESAPRGQGESVL